MVGKNKFKETFLYLLFGIITTIINIICYYICYSNLELSNTLSNIIAWIVAVAIAFYTNKKWVYESKSFNKNIVINELITFIMARIATGILDIISMFILVDIMLCNAFLSKLLVNIIVIVINYITGKYLVFKKKKNNESIADD